MERIKGKIESILERRGIYGAENAMAARELSQMLKLSARTMRKIITDERRSGAPILSSTGKAHGYYLPAWGDKGIEEMTSYTSRQKARGARAYMLSRKVQKAIEAEAEPERAQLTIEQ